MKFYTVHGETGYSLPKVTLNHGKNEASRLAKGQRFQSSGVGGLRLQGSKVAGFHGYSVPGIHSCKVQSSRITGFHQSSPRFHSLNYHLGSVTFHLVPQPSGLI